MAKRAWMFQCHNLMCFSALFCCNTRKIALPSTQSALGLVAFFEESVDAF